MWSGEESLAPARRWRPTRAGSPQGSVVAGQGSARRSPRPVVREGDTQLETICGWQASAGIDERNNALTRALRTTCLPSVPVPPITNIEFLAIPVSARMQRVVRPVHLAQLYERLSRLFTSGSPLSHPSAPGQHPSDQPSATAIPAEKTSREMKTSCYV